MGSGASEVTLTIVNKFTDFKCSVCNCLLCSYKGEDVEIIAKCVKCGAYRKTGSASEDEAKTQTKE